MPSYGNLHFSDWALIAAYVLMTLGIAAWTKLRAKNTTEEYLMAERSMNAVVVAITVFATLFSTISFVAVPGEAFNNGMGLMTGGVLAIAMYPLAIWLFLRFFFMAPTFTAYEYLEKRFCVSCRMTGSTMFIVIRLFYAASVFYSASVIFQSLVGWSPSVTIAVIGAITLMYTVTGGIKAVIWADVVQTLIIFIGIIAILFTLLKCVGFDVPAVFSFASKHGKTFEIFAKPEFYRINLQDRLNFWLLLSAAVFTPLLGFSSDQLVIQRLLTSKSYKAARRSVYINYFIGLPIIVMLYVIGLFLYYYYNGGARALPHGVNGDQAMGYFINTELPAPLPGIIVAALLSALMSTIAGVVNSLATVFHKDILVKWKPELSGGSHELRICQWLSVAAGVISVGIALFMVFIGQGVRSSLLEVCAVWSSLWMILLAAFLYGALSTRVSARAILVTLVIGGAMNLILPCVMYYLVPSDSRWGFSWVGVPGQITSLALPPLLSLIWPNTKDLTNLTVWTMTKKDI